MAKTKKSGLIPSLIIQETEEVHELLLIQGFKKFSNMIWVELVLKYFIKCLKKVLKLFDNTVITSLFFNPPFSLNFDPITPCMHFFV